MDVFDNFEKEGDSWLVYVLLICNVLVCLVGFRCRMGLCKGATYVWLPNCKGGNKG